MKILCPTDFSPASNNAIEYAAKLCQQLSASLTLMNVQKVTMAEGVSLFSGGERESVSEAKESAVRLEAICQDVNRAFKISCDYEIVPTMSSFEKAAGEEAGRFDLTVIGTNGTDSMVEFYFGSHSFRLSRKTAKPVLVVPQECSYKAISKVIFASGYHSGDILLLQQLKSFLALLNPTLHVIHVSEKDTEVGKDVFNSFCRLTEEALQGDRKISFERIIDVDTAHAISNYLNESDTDLLAICYEEHGFLYRMVHQNLVKSLTNNPDYPILICHR